MIVNYWHGYRALRCRALVFSAALATGFVAAPAFANDDDAYLEEVIVTGEKIERSLQDTASSVAVFNETSILEQNFTDLYDVINQTANVSGIFDGRGFTIRGVRNTGVSPGDQTSDVSTVYLDGVFIPSSVFAFSGLNLWDINSVEIFRGPQSTLQGRNALAGAIIARTVDPGNEWEGRVQLSASEYGGFRTSGAMSVPIVEDQLSARIAVDQTVSDGFANNIVLDTDDGDRKEASTFRTKLLFTPDAMPELTARLNFSYFDIEQGENRVEEDLFPDRISQQNIADVQQQESYLTSLELTSDLSDNLSLTSITALQDTDTDFLFDTSNDAGGGGLPGRTISHDEVLSQEIRLTYQAEKWTGIFGAYYFESESSFDNETFFSVASDFAFPDPTTFAGILFMTPAPDAAQIAQATFVRGQIVTLIPNFDVRFERGGRDDITNYALFGEVSYDLTERLNLTIGARIDNEEIDQSAFDSTIVPPLPQSGDATIDAIVAGVAAQFTNEIDLVAENDFDAFLPKVVLRYDWTDDLSTSFSAQQAYRAGGLSFNVFRAALPGLSSDQAALEAAGVVNSFDPEFTWNYEFALRSQWMERRLTLNANVFYINYEDQQINVQLSVNPLDTLTDNVGESEQKGFELELNALVNDRFTFFANLGYTSTEFTEAVETIGNVNLEGLEFAEAPEWTAGIGGRYNHPSGWFGNVRGRYKDESFSNVNNDDTAVNDSYFIVDVIVGYEAENYTAELFANNLTDKDYLTGNFLDPSPGAVAYAGEPRVVGIRMLLDF